MSEDDERVTECEMKVSSAKDLREFASKLVEIAVPYCDEYARRVGGELMNRTHRAREAAGFYISKLPHDIHTRDLHKFWQTMKERATSDQREKARLTLNPAVINLPSASQEEETRVFAAYQIASYTITMNADEGLQRGFFSPGTEAIEDLDLAFCLQIMGSRIFGEKGFELMQLR